MAKAILEKAKSTIKNERDEEEVAIVKEFMKKDAQFFHARQREEKVKSFESRRKKEKLISNLIHQTGHRIEIRPSLLGFVDVNKHRTNKWIPKLRGELAAWNIVFAENLGLKKLNDLLLGDEHNGQGLKEDDPKRKWFEPKHLPVEDREEVVE
jgi:hypothetical protein